MFVIVSNNMQFTDSSIDEFITLYKKRYGVSLDREEATETGLKLCHLVQLVSFEKNNENEYARRETS